MRVCIDSIVEYMRKDPRVRLPSDIPSVTDHLPKELQKSFEVRERYVNLEGLEGHVRPYYRRGGAHAWDHILRVTKTACSIADKTDGVVNTSDLIAMVMLHDIVRDEGAGKGDDNVSRSVDEAQKILGSIIGYDKKDVKRILHGIETHSHTSTVEPQTTEAKILRDADKIDAAGYIGIARYFRTFHDDSRKMGEDKNVVVALLLKTARAYLKALSEAKKKPSGIGYTEEGTRILDERAKISEKFMSALIEELGQYEEEAKQSIMPSQEKYKHIEIARYFLNIEREVSLLDAARKYPYPLSEEECAEAGTERTDEAFRLNGQIGMVFLC